MSQKKYRFQNMSAQNIEYVSICERFDEQQTNYTGAQLNDIVRFSSKRSQILTYSIFALTYFEKGISFADSGISILTLNPVCVFNVAFIIFLLFALSSQPFFVQLVRVLL